MKANTFKEIFSETAGTFDYVLDRLILGFTKRIGYLMKGQGISQRDLAAKIGCSAPYVSKVFSGSPNLTLASMVKIADAVGCEISIAVSPKQTLHSTKVTTVSSSQSTATIDPNIFKNRFQSVFVGPVSQSVLSRSKDELSTSA